MAEAMERLLIVVMLCGRTVRYVRCPPGLPTMSAPARTVAQLVAALQAASDAKEQLVVLREMRVPLKDLEDLARWDAKHYTRTCIARDRYFELLLIGFEPGQQTSIHDYNGHEAWVHPLKGELTEERFAPGTDGRLQVVSSVQLGPTSYSYLGDPLSIHRFINSGSSRCLSLNLYCGPIRKWKVYDAHSGRSTTVGTPGT